ncbi:SAM-dependent methyltransferase [Elizabethkingia meningoseptica]|uniref:HsdM family class I SAM-dependent methyltransferase n=1 Tax=Elizabethkingia meningoseptica TaxID=238 RepID=UPI0023AF7CB1|nr:N-6 DNA methylase [Elizabethkingia meningoseptica]MDE5467416.1 SAM-dependent methyltransferase [Elizabethkingia meningoseptica]MDE5473354.1 SAM-dependent methyltransferase [Elizabethkingia meningoseptica]MDE5476787.1 SAM-dependent methyltransferase [Elizabethkingia meningoseptica]MDE5484735.1 SAM-dependent methyltransferase [Elizabethkingia meningoseptica]MDE5500187.1 SAM-dependent methyltransferase [Elizabethkingia meningoseptica]
MNQKIFKYLQDYDTKPIKINRLIISAFIQTNDLDVINNKFIQLYLIKPTNKIEYKKVQEFVSIIVEENSVFNFERLIELFEFVISPSDRIVNGAIYTPAEIREYIVNQAFDREGDALQNAKIADIACGCAGFLYTAAKELKRRTGNTYQYIFQNQIFGLDIQEYSVTRSKLLLSLLAISEGEDIEKFNFNIHKGDTLIFRWQTRYKNFGGFQIIVGNPPYVCARNLEDAVKDNLKNWAVCQTGNPDLYIPFFQIGYECLAPNGILGFITMNTFFKSLNGRALRNYFEENRATVRIIDFGTLQIFKSRSTYTCICFLENVEQNFVEYYKSVEKELPTNENQYSRINYQNLNAKNGWNLNNNEIISRIEAIGKPFGEKYKTRHGIATLRNDIYIFKPVREDNDFFYLQNGNLYPIEKGICKDILNSNKLSRDIDFDSVKEKVLFPYDNKEKPKALEEELLREQFPRAFEYLQIKRELLSKRDKGEGKYEKWFAFGRTQSLEKVTNKLFFPKFSDITPNYLISNDVDLLFYNGQAIIGHSEEEMQLIKKILESRLFWYYIKTTSKPYSSAYYSLNGTYIKNFGIPDFANSEIDFLLNETNQDMIDAFLEEYYNVRLTEDFLT